MWHVSPDQAPPQIIHSILDYISQVDIVKVTDPGASSLQPAVTAHIDRYITPYKSFHSPQVENAITHLRPKE
jgi:hypothetical protein